MDIKEIDSAMANNENQASTMKKGVVSKKPEEVTVKGAGKPKQTSVARQEVSKKAAAPAK